MNNRKLQWMVRAVCLLLALLMVLGFAVTLLPTRASGASEQYPSDLTVAIGIAYGAFAPKSYTLTAPGGFEIGYLHSGNFSTLTELEATTLTVYSTCENAYRIQFSVDESVADFSVQYPELSAIAKGQGLTAFPAFVSNGLCVRAGSFSTKDAAQVVCDKLRRVYAVQCSVVAPTATDITVFAGSEPAFTFDSGTSLKLGIQARQPSSGRYYLTAPDGYAYDGAMRFTRYGDAMTVASVLPIEEYVVGVLPYEISASWNTETQKAFSVCVRSYTLANLNKHNRTYGFDLCNTVDCQVYRGVTRVNDTVRSCVAATRHMVLTYSGKPIGAYYSSSTGGCTASAYDVWGGTSFPYLSANATPWEKYESYPSGSWTAEATPIALYESLKSKGYTGLTGAVAQMKINSFAHNSTYVNSITVTDVNGKSITISKCDRIRIALSKFVKSANFVVGKSGSSLSVTDYQLNVDSAKEYSLVGLTARTMYGNKIVPAGGKWVNTTSGKYWLMSALSVITSTGSYPANQAEQTVSCLPDLTKATVSAVSRTVQAKGSAGNFVLVGRGYGHGVGMSQYGAKDLGDLGYSYDTILSCYFPQTEISNMTVLK